MPARSVFHFDWVGKIEKAKIREGKIAGLVRCWNCEAISLGAELTSRQLQVWRPMGKLAGRILHEGWAHISQAEIAHAIADNRWIPIPNRTLIR